MPIIERYELKKYLPLNTSDVEEKQQKQVFDDEESHSNINDTQTSRWRTKEFYFYYMCMAVVIPYMFYTGNEISQANHPNYNQYNHLLSDGWIFERKIDNSDLQYASFRQQFPLLSSFAIVYIILSRLFEHIVSEKTADVGQRKKRYFYLISSVVSLIVLHGIHCIKIWLIVSISYCINSITKQKRCWNPALSWAFNIMVLFLNEYYNGYSFESIHKKLAILDSNSYYSGLLPRWHVFFNFTMLRLISFNMDYFWSRKVSSDQQQQPHTHTTSFPTDKERITTSCLPSDYNYSNYIMYIFYIPLYLCGPIITYNDFISQVFYIIPNSRQIQGSKISSKYILLYFIRFLFALLLMEVMLHYLYVVAISKSDILSASTSSAVTSIHYTPFEISMIGYFNLVIIWLKLLIMWRFFRLWALFDGIWTEENMIRCMSNNFSAQRFWKSWHRSFNRWIIRYIYVPLGGSKNLIWNSWIVFTFVAIWHDIELKLLAWGWLICLFLVPEIVGSKVFTYKKFGHTWYYRFVCGLCGALNVLLMMTANLVGFCLGLDGIKYMWLEIIGSLDGLIFLFLTIACLYIAVQVMFEIRQSEKRRGDPKWTM
ncbi:MBOAT, membrane-bound O-acyltransferase family-domain-containing protein [Mycotypha africana]|uniref:MBOAT, membrane-bound O-acyltransferase family-domain-containing protein n=1 Tax=Mycotypha africana TaxID=64632 RepID=UPI00230070BE|nr:MBOAT, membrane-bound O-acyltransferase family-domain-containing protein [Mycotypha africana]KAI8991875.1 MBOAT, membrane-bound O-acyltransferase family-domain-containing protein [Mycotypha africana]